VETGVANMATVRLNQVIGDLRGRLAPGGCEEATDAALLERFFARRDEAAFAALVRRHGPMVYGVCRRLLRDAHDAEDVFQATFLVLVRKGPAVRLLRSVGNWLYGVARRTALEARRAAARRRVKEAGAMPRSAAEEDTRDDLREVLDEEMARLPDKLRAPLVLCDLEGKSRKEAARALGWPEGTVASRLASARKALAGRLTRRGLAVPGALIAGVLAGETASAGVPPALVGSTVRVAAGRAVVPSGVAALVKGVMVTMLVKKLKAGVAVLLTAAALGAGGLTFTGAGGSTARAADGEKSRNPLDALRHENELLKLNLQVVLEKVRAQEAELAALKKDGHTFSFQLDKSPVKPVIIGPIEGKFFTDTVKEFKPGTVELRVQPKIEVDSSAKYQVQLDVPASDLMHRAETALKALREARDAKARQEAIKQLESVLPLLSKPRRDIEIEAK
jgi:RNA polymerase sigma factor (sigma-70 family)